MAKADNLLVPNADQLVALDTIVTPKSSGVGKLSKKEVVKEWIPGL